jgi:hypothetical protein
MAPIQGTVYKATNTHHPYPYITQMSLDEVQAHQNRECIACLMREKTMITPNASPNMFSRLKEGVKAFFRCQHRTSQRKPNAASANVLESLCGDQGNTAIPMTEQLSCAIQAPAPTLTLTQASTISSTATTIISPPSTEVSSQAPQLPPFAAFVASWSDEESIEDGLDPWVDFSGIYFHDDDDVTTTPSETSSLELETAVSLSLTLLRARSLTVRTKRADSVAKRTASGSRFTEEVPSVRPNVLARTHRRAPVVGKRDGMGPDVFANTRGRSPIVKVKWPDVLGFMRGR